jgi:hypothetical protein
VLHRALPGCETANDMEPLEEVRMDFSRPSALRLWGFLALAAGGVLLGIGSISNWAVVGFTGDKAHALDIPTKGTDIWEGKATLAFGLIALIGMIVVRLASSDRFRKAIAYLIVASGVAGAGIGVLDAARVVDRFSGGNSALTAIAQKAAASLGLPVAKILQELQANRDKYIFVSRGLGLWLVIGGGVLVAIGGVLSVVWANRLAARGA